MNRTPKIPRRKSYPARFYKEAALRHAVAKHDPNAGRLSFSLLVIGHAVETLEITFYEGDKTHGETADPSNQNFGTQGML